MPRVQVLPKLGPTSKERLGAGIASAFGAVGKGLQTASEFRHRADLEADKKQKQMARFLTSTSILLNKLPPDQRRGPLGIVRDNFPEMYPALISSMSTTLPEDIKGQIEIISSDAARRVSANPNADQLAQVERGLRHGIESFFKDHPQFRQQINDYFNWNLTFVDFQGLGTVAGQKPEPKRATDILAEIFSQYKPQEQEQSASPSPQGQQQPQPQQPQGPPQPGGAPPVPPQGQPQPSQPIPSPGGAPPDEPFKVDQGLLGAFAGTPIGEAFERRFGEKARTQPSLETQGGLDVNRFRERKSQQAKARKSRTEAGTVPKQHINWVAYMDESQPEVAATFNSLRSEGLSWEKIYTTLKEMGAFEGTSY